MPHLLFLAHRIPYPPNKGDKIRSFHLLEHFSRYYEVHLGAFIDDDHDWSYVRDVQQLCATAHFSRLNPTIARVRSLAGFVRGGALSISYYRDGAMQSWVNATLKDQGIERAFVFSSAMAQFIPPSHQRRVRRVIDFVDVDSDKWAQYSFSKSWPMSWIYRREARTLLEYDSLLAANFDASVFVSAREAELFRRLAPQAAGRVRYVSNGVDVEYFSPDREFPNPYPLSETAIVFTGAMDYWANVDAVCWFARDVFPRLRGLDKRLRFYIVGARPARQVAQLAAVDGVIVTGALRDIRPYVRHAAVSVAPLRIARGVQNKVLEAMAMGRPVVASPQALDGLDVQIGYEVLRADGAEAFIDQLSKVLSDSAFASSIGMAGRAGVLSGYTWDKTLASVCSLFGDDVDQGKSENERARELSLAAHR